MEKVFIDNAEQAELLKANLVIGQFITSCSHSMRGPLKSIAGLVNLLGNYKNLSESDVKTFLDLIGNTAIKMEQMLDGLEHFLENSKRELAYQPVDCKKIIDHVLKKYGQELLLAKIKVNVAVRQQSTVFSDGPRLRLVFSHLIQNAIQFRDIDKQDNRIDISVKMINGRYVMVVSDNGIGIAEDNHQKIFQLFFRASNKSVGSGIGLYVVNEVVKKMKGTIEVDSIPGRGSSFTIHLKNFDRRPE